MNSNNQSLTQSLGINPRFCTPYDGSWLASPAELAAARQLKQEYQKHIQAYIKKRRRINRAIHQDD